ncbi:hypothetical protein [Mycobacterium seoulense]|uniref:Uncharacterized protein n=1 Tax=Mycobacterium seoulense TaxID=386911 RepID=A0A7I7P6H5_9MYCO|nr:hypothetical protein [Mycobacterium seoulense]MCV7439100.1 hypothetical protein [Mycobacterium seoulense]BBY04160.1 hypothetical protein MSEO_46590 [Mycobacterium seoulense]
MNGDEPLVADERHISEGFWEVLGMTPLLLVCIAAAAPIAGLGLLNLQARLERWDYERHAED